MTRREYLLAELRCASLRAKLLAADINAVGVALSAGLIDPNEAIELLGDCNCMFLIAPREEEPK